MSIDIENPGIDEAALKAALNELLNKEAGRVLKRVAATPYTANADLAVIPADDTLPQVDEGTQVQTLVVQADNADDVIDIEFNGAGGMSTGGALIAAMFIDGASDAVRAAWTNIPAVNTILPFQPLVYSYAPGDTSAHTVTVRCGSNTGTGRLNGTHNARWLGGAIAATLTATIRRP